MEAVRCEPQGPGLGKLSPVLQPSLQVIVLPRNWTWSAPLGSGTRRQRQRRSPEPAGGRHMAQRSPSRKWSRVSSPRGLPAWRRRAPEPTPTTADARAWERPLVFALGRWSSPSGRDLTCWCCFFCRCRLTFLARPSSALEDRCPRGTLQGAQLDLCKQTQCAAFALKSLSLCSPAVHPLPAAQAWT